MYGSMQPQHKAMFEGLIELLKSSDERNEDVSTQQMKPFQDAASPRETNRAMGDNDSTERLKAALMLIIIASVLLMALMLFTDAVQRSELRDLQRRVATLEQQQR
jgi:hypothetical protein